jgi:class 3 adenylate cyclase
VYKVETIGDAYMCASGVPIRNGNQHVLDVCVVTMAFLEAATSMHVEHMGVDYTLRMRGGVHTGAVAAGVIGVHAPRYCLFGDTVSWQAAAGGVDAVR